MNNKTCKCGNLKVTFAKGVMTIEGGFLYGNTKAWARCRECPDAVRVGYYIHYAKDGEVFHKSEDKPLGKRREKSGKSARSKSRKGHSSNAKGETWRFVD